MRGTHLDQRPLRAATGVAARGVCFSLLSTTQEWRFSLRRGRFRQPRAPVVFYGQVLMPFSLVMFAEDC